MDFEWMRLRCDALEFTANLSKKLIENWCKECGVTTPVGYDNDTLHGIMKIYTNRPGYLIGKGGEKIETFKAELKKAFNKEYQVIFVEIRGEFVNINID